MRGEKGGAGATHGGCEELLYHVGGEFLRGKGRDAAAETLRKPACQRSVPESERVLHDIVSVLVGYEHGAVVNDLPRKGADHTP